MEKSHVTPFRSTNLFYHSVCFNSCKLIPNFNFPNLNNYCNKWDPPLVDGRCGGLMVSALVSGASDPGASPKQGHCVVLLGKTLYSQCLSPPRCINGYQQFNAVGNPAMN